MVLGVIINFIAQIVDIWIFPWILKPLHLGSSCGWKGHYLDLMGWERYINKQRFDILDDILNDENEITKNIGVKKCKRF